MRRFSFILLLFLVACSKASVVQNNEPLQFSTKLKPMTKGYVTGIVFEDTPADSLHSSFTATPRTIMLSSYISSGENIGNYFIGEVFQRDDDGIWKHNPAYYWPFASTMDFLGYSSDIPFTSSQVKWYKSNCASYVQLSVPRVYTQDDILFTSVYGCPSSKGNVPVQLKMNHAQAWIQVRFNISGSILDSTVIINKVVLSDIYTTGTFNIENNCGEAFGYWNFRYDRREDTVMDDNTGLYGKYLTTESQYLDMLLPEQERKTIVIYYSFSYSSLIFKHSIELPQATWLMGKKYIYDLTLSPYEVRVKPSVEDWIIEEVLL